MVAAGTWNPLWLRPPANVSLLTPGQDRISRSSCWKTSSFIIALLVLVLTSQRDDRKLASRLALPLRQLRHLGHNEAVDPFSLVARQDRGRHRHGLRADLDSDIRLGHEIEVPAGVTT